MTDDGTLGAVQPLVSESSLPPEEQAKRLKDEVKRLEARVDREWSRIFRWLVLACVVLGGLALWYMNSYLEARGALKDVCKFVSREAVNLPDEAIGMGRSADTLGGANDVCFEQSALP